MKKVYFYFIITALLFSCNKVSTVLHKNEVLGKITETNTSGSGYRDFEGKFIEYTYNDFGGFRLAIFNNKIKWRGYKGYFDNIVSEVSPQISKVSDSTYFMSWILPNGGSDNVVVNFQSKSVYAHLDSGESVENSESDFELINGTINCGPSVDCSFPEGELTSMFKVVSILESNTEKYGLAKIYTTEKPLIEQDVAARIDLQGKRLNIKTESGVLSVEVKSKTTKITEPIGLPNLYKTYATKVGKNIYFISYKRSESDSQNLVFNLNTKKVFDHRFNDEGIREEKIYDFDVENIN